MTTVARTTLAIDVRAVAPVGANDVVVDVFEPEPVGDDPVVLCCAPGGGMSRGYFDLQAPPGFGNYSMAAHLVDRGFVVVTIDPPGIGESSVPDDGYALTPAVVADVHAYAFAEVLTRWPRAIAVGVGHSAGALLTVVQQARHRTYAALGLLGFANGGHVPAEPTGPGAEAHDSRRRSRDSVRDPMAEARRERFGLTVAELSMIDDPEALQRGIIELVRDRFGRPFPGGGTTASEFLLGGMTVPQPVLETLGGVRSPLLAVVGLTSMIDGSIAPEMAAVDVPVFLGLGGRDIAGVPHDIPAQFPGSRDITLFVLPDAGHNHNIAPNREALWTRLADWVRGIEP